MTTFIDNLRKSQKLLYAFVLTWLIPIATNVASNILTTLYGAVAADRALQKCRTVHGSQ